jgi:hypothetical protein
MKKIMGKFMACMTSSTEPEKMEPVSIQTSQQ